jgi:tRNA1(Val) A37 N6-methylase TrmN6
VNFTASYSQPQTYRFSLDSIELAKYVADQLNSMTAEEKSQLRVADLCAGCGVIGLELVFHQSEIRTVDFIEVQDVDRSHVEANSVTVPASTEGRQLQWCEMNYQNLIGHETWRGRYDLVLCNPPYFEPHQGRRPPDTFKSRCRFFLDASFRDLLRCIEWITAPGGQAIVLIRGLQDHGVAWQQRQLDLGEIWGTRGQGVAEIRGTTVYRYQADAIKALESAPI